MNDMYMGSAVDLTWDLPPSERVGERRPVGEAAPWRRTISVLAISALLCLLIGGITSHYRAAVGVVDTGMCTRN